MKLISLGRLYYFKKRLLSELGTDIATIDYVDNKLLGYINNVKYKGKKIVFKNGSTKIASIDATPFLRDGMVDSVDIVEGSADGDFAGRKVLRVTFNTDSGKKEIEIPISGKDGIFDADNYYTREDIDDSFATREELGNYALKDDLKDYATKEEIQDLEGIPEGGKEGQVLSMGSEGGLEWRDMEPSSENTLPSDGSIGDILKKTSGGAKWHTPLIYIKHPNENADNPTLVAGEGNKADNIRDGVIVGSNNNCPSREKDIFVFGKDNQVGDNQDNDIGGSSIAIGKGNTLHAGENITEGTTGTINTVCLGFNNISTGNLSAGGSSPSHIMIGRGLQCTRTLYPKNTGEHEIAIGFDNISSDDSFLTIGSGGHRNIFEIKQNGNVLIKQKGDTNLPTLCIQDALEELKSNNGDVDLSDYYTKSEVDAAISKAALEGVVELDGYATEQWVKDKHYLTEHQSLDGLASESYVDGKVEEVKQSIPNLNGYATQEWVEKKGYLTVHQDLTGYAKTSDIESKIAQAKDELEGKIDNVDFASYLTKEEAGHTYQPKGDYLTKHQSLEEYATKEYVDGKVADIDDKIPNVDNFVTNEELENKGYLTQHQSLAGLATAADITREINSATSDMATQSWVEEKGYLSSESLGDYISKSDIEHIKNEIRNELKSEYDSQIQILNSIISALENRIGSLQGFVSQFPTEGDEVYAIVNGKAEAVAPSGMSVTYKETETE